MLALIVFGAARIARHAVTSVTLGLVAAGALALHLLGVHFAIVLSVAGVIGALATRGAWLAAGLVTLVLGVAVTVVPELRPVGDPGVMGAVGALQRPGLGRLLAAGLATGLLTFGGAYTAVPIVRQTAAGPGGWLSSGQLLDGIALGGVLPAPLIIFTTFVGYVGGGLTGALVMTAGVFVPAFAFTLVGFRYLERLMADRRLHAFFDAVAAGVVGIIAGTAVELAPATVGTFAAAAISVVALALIVAWRSRAAIPVGVLAAAAAGHLLLR